MAFYQKFAWLEKPEIKTLLHSLKAYKNNNFQFVGGCIRDSLLNKIPEDFDLATRLPPGEVINLLNANNIKNISINSKYGTVVALVNKVAFEITTLRKDVKTYGRKAVVEFTDDYLEDAKRRDFTFNALYLNPTTYEITDYFNGALDLKKGRVKFIGNIEARITEDYLRILRYVRFYTIYGKILPSSAEIKTIKTLTPLLKNLSKERITSELNKLLMAPNAHRGIALFNQLAISPVLFGEAGLNIKNLLRLYRLEDKYKRASNVILRLLSVLNDFAVVNTLYLERKVKRYVNYLIKLDSLVNSSLMERPFKNDRIYEIAAFFPSNILEDYAILALSKQPHKKHIEYYNNLLKISLQVKSFKLPINGNDLISLGVNSGLKIKNVLHTLTVWGLKNQVTLRQDYISYLKNNLLK